MVAYFVQMLVAPATAIGRVLAQRPSFRRLAAYVAAMGLVRGLVEALWILLMAGQLRAVVMGGQTGAWLFGEAGPFVLASVLTGLLRWGLFALVPYALGRFSGGRGRWVDFLRVYGVAMGIYLVTIVPNFSYVFWRLPVFAVALSPAYNPFFGLGQLLTSGWLWWFGYVSCRRLHGLHRLESVLVGLALPAANLGLFVLAARVFFNLRWLRGLPLAQTFWIATAVFIAAALAAIPLLLWLGSRYARSEGASTTRMEA